MMTNKKKKTILATSGAAGALIVGAAFAAPAAQAQSAVSLAELVPALSAPQTAADQVPAVVDLEALGVTDTSTVRALGSEGDASYWVARSGAEDICLIVHIAGGDEIGASSCGPVTSFASTGMGLMAGADPTIEESTAEGYLLPADVQIPGEAGVSARSADPSSSANLLIVAPGDEVEAFETERADGSTFTFNPLPAR
jgi:hypothetical protein